MQRFGDASCTTADMTPHGLLCNLVMEHDPGEQRLATLGGQRITYCDIKWPCEVAAWQRDAKVSVCMIRGLVYNVDCNPTLHPSV